MAGKKTDTKFTIVFSRYESSHLHVAEILNSKGYRGKAQYIVNAVLHYENCDKQLDMKRPSRIDEKAIEAVVNRLLRDMEVISVSSNKTINSVPEKRSNMQPEPVDTISFEEAVEELGEVGYEAVLSALDMFRKKQ